MTAKQSKAFSAPLSTLGQKALQYARRGKAVFPCRPNKSPYCAGGFHAATLDEAQVRAWWQRWPKAMIGVATGAASGLFVLDVDSDKGGDESLAALEAEYGLLPATTVIRTPRGGRHVYFAHVDGYRCGVDALGPGLDLRTDGGYVITAPSRNHKGRYRVETRVDELPAPPAWLLELLRAEQGRSCSASSAGGERSRRRDVSIDVDGPPIGEGARNHALASIAGSLKARGLEGEDLAAALGDTNAARCTPPLPDSEVLKVARSVDRYPTGAPLAPSGETLRALDRITREVIEGRSWPKIAGKQERSLMAALVQIGRERSQLIPAGVRIPVSVRQLALKAGTSKTGAINALNRLREADLVARDDSDRQDPTHAGAIVILLGRANLDHRPTNAGSGMRGQPLRGMPITAPRLRWSAAGKLRLGKSGEEIIDILEDQGGRIDLQDLAAIMGAARVRDLKRRVVLPRLVERGIATLEGDTLQLREDWRDALERERVAMGEVEKAQLDAEKYAREREAWALRAVPDQDPTHEEIAQERQERLEGKTAHAYAQLMDPQSKAGRVYRSGLERGATPEALASILANGAAHSRGNPDAWRAWLEPVHRALELIEGKAA